MCARQFLAIALSLCACSNALSSDNELMREFLEEAPQKWEQYRPFGRRLQGLRTEESRIEDGTLVRRWRYEYKANRDCRLRVEETILTPKSGRESYTAVVYGINPAYSFVLRRKSAGSTWVLAEVQPRDQGILKIVDRTFPQPWDEWGVLLLSLAGHDLAKLVKEPTFLLERVERIDRQGEQLVRVVFAKTGSGQTTKGGAFPIQTGSLVLDPQRYWCLRGYDVVGMHGDMRMSRKVEIDIVDSPSGFPIPRRKVQIGESILQGGIRDYGQVLTELEERDPLPLPDDREFTLTAFGLPEPPGVEWKKPTPWYLWAGLAAVVCLILGAVFAWLKRRSASTVERLPA